MTTETPGTYVIFEEGDADGGAPRRIIPQEGQALETVAQAHEILMALSPLAQDKKPLNIYERTARGWEQI